MLQRGSRYEKALLFESKADGSTVFEGIRPRKIGSATGVINHTIKATDRLDLLARHYYNDDRLWWRILDSNTEFLYGGDMVREEIVEGEKVLQKGMDGEVISIPKVRE